MEHLSHLRTWSFLVVVATLFAGTGTLEPGQSVPDEGVLQDTAGVIELGDAHIRCGKYFVLESRTFNGFDVKQVHVVLPMSADRIALVSLYYNDVRTIIDESKDPPVVIRQKDASGRVASEVRLSRAAFDEAKECLPPPDER